MQIKKNSKQLSKDKIIIIALIAISAITYLIFSFLFTRNGLMFMDNTIFDADIGRVYEELSTIDSIYQRFHVHPLYHVIFFPIAKIFIKLFHAPLGIILMNCIVGILNVLMIYLILKEHKVKTITALAITLIWLFSTTQMLATMIERYQFAGLFLLLTYYFHIKISSRPKHYTTLRNICAIISIGITVFSALFVFLLLLFDISRKNMKKEILSGCIIIATLAIAICIQVYMQQDLINEAKQGYAWEFEYPKIILRERSLGGYLMRLPHFFIGNIISPQLRTEADDFKIGWKPDHVETFAVDYGNIFYEVSILQIIGMILYFPMLVIGLYKTITSKNKRKNLFFLTYYILTVLFFSYFGETRILYAQYFTFPLFIFISNGIPAKEERKEKIFQILLFITALFVAMNNIIIYYQLYKLFL